jgi:phage FluMu protein Com
MRCADCGDRFMVTRASLERRTRVRCPACGSLAVDPSKDAHDALVRGMDSKRYVDEVRQG